MLNGYNNNTAVLNYSNCKNDQKCQTLSAVSLEIKKRAIRNLPRMKKKIEKESEKEMKKKI